ncbi:MAG: hypothetical protein WCI52_01710 [bacterium]
MPNITPTKQVQILADALKKRNIEFELEYWDGHKHIDIYIPRDNLYIEIDGLQHYTDHKHLIADFNRDYFSFKDGFFTKRITNELIETHSEEIADAIADVVNNAPNRIGEKILLDQDRDIEIPDIHDIKWPESHAFMVNDLTKSIKCAEANYLVALGLFCYTEILGRQLLRFRKKDRTASFNNKDCFESFAKEYLGYSEILKAHPKLYDIYRHGLCHEFYIKANPGGQSVVALYFGNEDEKLKSQGIDITKGIAIDKSDRFRVFIIEPYLRDFVAGVRKLSSEMNAEKWNPDEMTS